MDNKLCITIDGSKIIDIPSFYNIINEIFMQEEDWKIGYSLDALDDLLYGGYGAAKNFAHIEIHWKDIESSRCALGKEATIQYYKEKLASPLSYNKKMFLEKLDNMMSGNGPTYFDIIMEIISAHPNIHLIKN